MPRTISNTTIKELYRSETGEYLQTLLSLSSPYWAEPVTVCDDGITLISEGVTYFGYWFEITWPNDEDNVVPEARLVIASDRRIVKAVRQLPARSPVTVLVSYVNATTPDVVERSLILTMRGVEWNSDSISATLTFPILYQEPYPGYYFTPDIYPGVFL